MNNRLLLFVAYIFLVGCASFPLATSYTDPISYDVEIGKTTKSDIINTFGLGESESSFDTKGVSTLLSYACGRDSGLTLCVTKSQATICTPCGVPVNFHEPYSTVTFRFSNDLLTDVNYFTGPYNYHPMITSNWVSHAPKELVGNYSTQKVTR